MTDIVERLRKGCECCDGPWECSVRIEAADEIERLREELDAALELGREGIEMASDAYDKEIERLRKRGVA